MGSDEKIQFAPVSQCYLEIAKIVSDVFVKLYKSGSLSNILRTNDGIFAIFLLLLAIFYCLMGKKFKNFTVITILSVTVYSILTEYSDYVNPVATNMNFIFDLGNKFNLKKYLPTVLSKDISELQVAFIILAILITIVLCFLAPIGEYFGLFAFYYYLMVKFESIFKYEREHIFSYIHCVFAILITCIAYLTLKVVEALIAAFLSSLVGSIILLIASSAYFNLPDKFEDFLKSLAKLDSTCLSNPGMIYLILLLAFTMMFQLKTFKNEK